MAKYRIVRCSDGTYDIQEWTWWFPVWLYAGSSTTISEAKAKAKSHLVKRRRVVIWRSDKT